jgi:hypothetical protein
MRARVRALGVSVLIALVLAGAFPVIAVAWPACDGPSGTNLFAGNARFAGGLRGVYAEIEWFNTHLCVQTGDPEWSWSMSWVSLDGPNSDQVAGVSIFQGGFTKCAPAGTGSCPFNGGVSYHWFYYGREEGQCGAAYNSTIRKAPKGNAGPGVYDYEVSKAPDGDYHFYINEVSQYAKAGYTIDDCWGGVGVVGVEWQNEMLDPNDQNGGTVSNHQQFFAVQYKDGSGWHSANRPLGSLCDANSNPASWHCGWGSTSGTFFNEWDERAP